jgi:signal peptidase I
LESSLEPPTPPAEAASPSQPTATTTPTRGSRLLREIVETALLTAIIFLLVNAATGRFQIDGSSMEPNLHHAERVIVDKVSYLLGQPQRGDIVVFALEGQPKDYIKRVIGLPGETIEMSGGSIYIGGQLLEEPYVLPSPGGGFPARKLGEGEYFVLGDNRGNSSDSRSFGPIRLSNVVGRAWIIYWPPTDWAIVPHHTYAAGNSP